MAGEFFPRRDGELRYWSAYLAARILAAPQDYVLSPETAADFAAAQASYAQAYDRAINPATATPPAIEAKRNTRAAMIVWLRRMNGFLKSRPELTPAVQVGLGLNPRKRGGRSPRIRRPDTPPTMALESVSGHTAQVRLLVPNSQRRGRPRGVKGANIYWFAGPQAPTSLREWRLLTETGLTRVTLRFPLRLPPGAQVWLSARWKNARCEYGPPANPLTFNLPGGMVEMKNHVRHAGRVALAA